MSEAAPTTNTEQAATQTAAATSQVPAPTPAPATYSNLKKASWFTAGAILGAAATWFFMKD